ncbi:MAG: transposase [Microcystaceae cyanobacterium]
MAYFDNGTTKGVIEGMNNKLELIKGRGSGLRNLRSFRASLCP